MVVPVIETLEAAAQPNAGVTGQDARPSTRSRSDDVPKAIGNEAGGRVMSVGKRWRNVSPRGVSGRDEHGLFRARIPWAPLERGVFGVDQLPAERGVLSREQ